LNSHLPIRVRIALTLLTAVALLPTAGLLRQFMSPEGLTGSIPADEAGELDRRLADLKAALPTHSTVGYLSLSSKGPSDSYATARFYFTEYALAPIIVVNDARRELVIADFAGAPRGVPAAIPSELELVRNFGGGFALLRRRGG
jgi:hypothetical protein